MTLSIDVIGAGGHAKVVIDALQKSGHSLQHVFNLPLPPSWAEQEKCAAIIAIGDNRLRQEISQKYSDSEVQWVNVIHPSAIIHEMVILGKGTYVGAGVIIQPDVHIGDHCIINTGAIIEHDSVIQDYAHLGPRTTLTGAVEIGEGCFIGAGSTIIPQQKVGEWSLIGAGSTVIKSIPSHSKAWGTPCRIVKKSL